MSVYFFFIIDTNLMCVADLKTYMRQKYCIFSVIPKPKVNNYRISNAFDTVLLNIMTIDLT